MTTISRSIPQSPTKSSSIGGWRGLIEEYRQFLPVSSKTPVITLLEGNTPLIRRDVKVFVKYDGLNPTGSFKDRGMTMAISKAKEEGAKAVICASTGNTSAAAAAYARRAGMRAFVIIPDGYDDALKIVRQLSENYPVTLVNSVNPYRLEGQKTAAFEIVDVLGNAPDWLCIPVGNAGNISAYWMGFCQYHQIGKCDRLPKMMGFQAAGAAPFISKQPVDHPETLATAIRIGNPANWEKAWAASHAVNQPAPLLWQDY